MLSGIARLPGTVTAWAMGEADETTTSLAVIARTAHDDLPARLYNPNTATLFCGG